MTYSPFESADAAGAEYALGGDIGQSFDPTALAVVRKMYASADRPIFQVGHLERLPLQMPYPAQIDHIERQIARLMSHKRLQTMPELVLDVTGVGKPIADLFAVRGFPTINVTITAGDTVTSEGLNFHVPKLILVSKMQALLHNGQLKIHKDLADAQVLIDELQSFQASVSATGYWRFGARSGKHDDLVLAVAIALWRLAGDTCFPGWGIFEHYRKEYGNGGVDREPSPYPPPQTAPATVVLKPTVTGISQVTGLFGRAYLPDRDGNFAMSEEDAKVFIGRGWLVVKRG
jgi:hypothetical protein